MDNFPALAGIAGTSFILALSGALMPGPLFTLTVAEAARRGTRAGPMIITGHGLLELLLVVAVIKGLGPFLKEPPVIGTIALLGGIILLVMGIDMARKAGSLSLEQDTVQSDQAPARHPIVLGFVGSLANPYWIIWWVTIGLGYLITASHFGWPGLVTFFLGHIAADYAWYILIALSVSRGRGLLSDKSYQTMIRCCGIFLIGFGTWFFGTAFEHLSGSILLL